ncbi:MAG: hypothetical protein NTY77_14715 [Elusimicrobia bacterium]|nr:hypothetical protein [Elusimicrobiota bacterium]
MRNRTLIVAILILPSALLAQSGRRGGAPARATFRGSSAAPRTVVTHLAPVVRSNSVLTSHPVTVSQAGRATAIQGSVIAPSGVTFSGVTSRFEASRARSGRSWSVGSYKSNLRGRGSFGARRADDPQPPAEAPAYIPPYDYTPGALIRTEGLGYKATPTNDARWANNDPGYAIVQDPQQTVTLNPFPGIHVGRADRLPSAGGASGRNAITPNEVASQGD